MAEGKGDVAFVKHKTTQKVVDKRGHGKWADYEYLCRDGDRKGKTQDSDSLYAVSVHTYIIQGRRTAHLPLLPKYQTKNTSKFRFAKC